MRILDPIHKYLVFSDHEARIVDSPLFQRLRYIRQMGFAEYAFPGAVHNRFLHSLGVCHLAGRAFDALFAYSSEIPLKQKADLRQLVRVAALLHDIGHGPLSHVSESVMPNREALFKNLKLELNTALNTHAESKKNAPFTTDSKLKGKAQHEDYSLWIILESEIKKVIESMGLDPLDVAYLLNKNIVPGNRELFLVKGVDYSPVLQQIIHSDMDMDRMDYLQRDSYFCGLDYGFCDHEWLLNNLLLHIQDDKAFLSIGQKAVYSVENFYLGRRHMGLAVYFHHKMIIMDKMLFHYFESEDCDYKIPTSFEEYLHCTDGSLYENLALNAKHNEWAKRIVEKLPYTKAYEFHYPYNERQTWERKIENLKNKLHDQGTHFIHYNSKNKAKSVYLIGEQDSYPIYIKDEKTRQVQPLRERMEVFSHQNNIFLIDRIYTPPPLDPFKRKTRNSVVKNPALTI